MQISVLNAFSFPQGIRMLKVYFTIIKPILEYAVPVWQAIPEYLSHKIESVQRRALKIITWSYDELLQLLNVEKLQARREKLCKQYIWIKLKLQITF